MKRQTSDLDERIGGKNWMKVPLTEGQNFHLNPRDQVIGIQNNLSLSMGISPNRQLALQHN